MNKSKVLIISPHPDDELFALPHARQLESIGSLITVLFITATPKRSREAIRSCNTLGWDYLFANDLGFVFHDGYMHKEFINLKLLFESIFNDYDHILSPVIEGGHQDHDTVGVACLRLSNKFKDSNFIFYPLYTATKFLGFFSVMSANKYSLDLFNMRYLQSKQKPILTLYLMFVVYKSQLRSWIFLLLPFIYRIISNQKPIFFTKKYTKDLTQAEIINSLSSSPFYKIRCSQSSWIKSLS